MDKISVNTYRPLQRVVACLVMVSFTLTQATQVAALTLATVPLVTTTTSQVKPNLMYVLDDSGSMAWDYTPDYINDATISDPSNPGIGLPGSSGDAGTATIALGAITGITALGGNVYSLGTPTVLIEGGGGTGASATVTLNATTKKIQSVTVTNGGTGYTSAPYIAFIGGLASSAWGMCWGTTGASNQGGVPKDTTQSPTCTTTTQPQYATGKVNYQFYDPAIRYLPPLNANGTSYANAVPTGASSDAYLSGAAKNLTNAWTHEVWCNVSTAAPSLADPTAGGKCRELLDTSPIANPAWTGPADLVHPQFIYNVYPNATYTFRKTYNGPASYYTMSPIEYCTDTSYSTCIRSTTGQVVSGVIYNVPSYYRWCAYYNSNAKSFGACQGQRDLSHYIPNYLGGWVSGGTTGTAGTAALTVTSVGAGKSLSDIKVDGVSLIAAGSKPITDTGAYTTTSFATAICTAVEANKTVSGYGCSAAGPVATLQSVVFGDIQPEPAVAVTVPNDGLATNSTGRIAVANPQLNPGYQISSIKVGAGGNELISTTVTAVADGGQTAAAICNAINSGPNQATYIARSGALLPATPTFGTCDVHASATVEVQRIPADTTDNTKDFVITGPTGNAGTITLNSVGGVTKLGGITLNAVSILSTAGITFADGTSTTANAATLRDNINAGTSGCVATASGNRVTLSTCTGALAVVSGATAATGKFGVASTGHTYGADLGGIQVNTVNLAGHITSSSLTNGTLYATNAATLITAINAGTGTHGYTAASPAVLNGSNYEITVSAPAASGNSLNGLSFNFLDGTAVAAGGGGTAPSWTFRISDATSDNVKISRLQCGSSGTTDIITQNTATTGAGAATDYINNLVNGAGGLNGRSWTHPTYGVLWTWSCTTPTVGTPSSHCIATGAGGSDPCGDAAFNTVTKGAGITMTTPTRTQIYGAGSAPTWTFDVTGASADNANVTAMSCGADAVLTGTASTGAVSLSSDQITRINTLANGASGLIHADKNSYDYTCTTPSNATPKSTCTVVGPSGVAACTNLTFANDASITIANASAATCGSTASTWTFNIAAAGDNQLVNSIQCAGTNTQSQVSSSSGDGSHSTSRNWARDVIGGILDSGDDGGLTTRGANGYSYSCTAPPNTSPSSSTCTVTGPGSASCTNLTFNVDAGITISAETAKSTACLNPQWTFDITGATTDNKSITSVKCGATNTTDAVSSGTATASSSAIDRINNLVKNNGASDLESLAGNGYSMSCTTPTAAAGKSTCTVTGPTGAAKCTTFGFTNDASITIANNVRTNAGGTATPGKWEFDITNATTANETISHLYCEGHRSFDETTLPSTGTSTTAAWTRINNLTQGATGLNGLAVNSYAMSCTAATSTSAFSDCTVTGPVGPTNCAASPYLTFTKDATITVDTPVETSAGGAAAVAIDNFAPSLSTVAAFSGGFTDQSAAVTGMAASGTIAITATIAMTGGLAASTTAIGITPLTTVVAGGVNPSTATNYWTGVGTFKRVDIVATNDVYARASGRTDCTGATCTYNQEIQNFANWYSYYRTRMQMMKSATTQAFSPLTGTYRIGYENICSSVANPKRPVAEFSDTGETAGHRAAWWNDLVTESTNCATPLRKTTAKIGRYYAGKLSTDPIQYSCQQNFMLLVTDGYWNEVDPSGTSVLAGDIGNVDNNVATAVRPYYDGQQATTTCPGTGATRTTASSCRTLADIAWYYYSTDLRSSAFSNTMNTTLARDVSENNVRVSTEDTNPAQHMNFYAMGLGIDGTLQYRSDYQTAISGHYAEIKAGTRNWPAVSNLDPTGVDDLWHATVSGHGKYFSARNLPAVVAGLSEALNKIGAQVGSSAAAAISSPTFVTGANNFAYAANYDTNGWVGDLQSRSVDTLTKTVSTDTNCGVSGSGCQWSVRAQIANMTWSARRLYISPASATSGDPLRPFTYGDLSGAEKAYFAPGTAPKLSQFDALVPDPSAPGEVTAENLVNFLRGDRSLERDGEISHAQIWRKRIDVLGDIVNTTPVFMTAPNQEPILMYTDAGYEAFKTGTAASRAPVVFSAANDGMLHAVNAHTAAVTVSGVSVQPGEEMWAYVPQQVMTSMKVLADATYSHRYFIDGPILVTDVNFGGGDSDWHTILIAGQGGGGTSYFALDVTNPLSPTFLWEFSHAGLGNTFGNPMVSKLHNGEWAVFFTSGYNNADGLGYLFAINPKTGALKAGFPLSTGSGTGVAPSNLGKLTLWKDNPSVDNTAQYAYAGDLNGDLWRFDLDPTGTGHTTVPVFKLAHFEANGVPQPITTAPEATTSGTYRVVYVGTGKYLENNQPSPPGVSDLTSTDVQSIYAIKDSLLAAQTTANPQTDTTTVGADTVPMFLRRTLIALKDDGSLITSTENLVTTESRMICNGPLSADFNPPTVSAVTGSCAGETGPAMDLSIYGGWYVDLPDPGERVNINPLLIGGTLSIASNVPNATSCTVGGYSYTTNVDFLTGLAVGQQTTVSTVTVTKLDGTTVSMQVAVTQGVPPVASTKHTKLVVGITPVWIDGVLYNLIAYADGSFLLEKIPLTAATCPGCTPNGAFGNKRSLWREFEAYQ